MKKLTLLSSIVLSAALAATPVIGAEDYRPFVTVDDSTGERGVYDDLVRIDTGFITKYLVDETGVTTADNGSLIPGGSLPSSIPTINLSELKFGLAGYLTGMGLMAQDNDFAGKTLNIAHLNVQANDTENVKNLAGFGMLGDFAGTLNFGNISAASDDLYTSAFGHLDGSIKAGAVLNFNGNIKAESGYWVESIVFADTIESGATININGNVHAISTGDDASGVSFYNIAEGAVANIKGNITASAKDTAYGVYAMGKGTVVISGNVYAESEDEYANAIYAKDANVILDTTSNANLSISSKVHPLGTTVDWWSVVLDDGTLPLQGAHTFTNGGEAFMVVADDSTINFNTHVKLTGGMIRTGWGGGIVNVAAGKTVDLGETVLEHFKNVKMNVGQGAALITTGKTRIIEDGGDYSIAGGGSVYLLGGVESVVNGPAEIRVNGGSTLGVDISKSFVKPTEVINIDLSGNSTFEFYGEASAMGLNKGDDIDNVIVNIEAGNFANRAIFSDFQHDASSGVITYEGLLERANMSDAFLAAAMIHNRYTGYTMVRDHFISAARRSGEGYRGQAYCDPCEAVQGMPDPCDPCGTGFSKRAGSTARSAWVNYVGRADTYQGGYAYGDGWNIGSNGVQLGTDLYRTSRSQFGVIFGYEGGWATNNVGNNTDRVDSDDIYAGLYAARVLRNGADVRLVYNHGWQSFDMNRSGWKSHFKGRTNEVNLEFGKRFYSGAWSFRPFMGADVFATRLNGAKEVGGSGMVDPGIDYNGMNMTQVFIRPGIDVRFERNRFAFNTGLSYAYDMSNPQYRTWVTSQDPGGDAAWLYGSDLGREILSFNVGGSYQLGRSRNFTVFGGYDGLAVVDRTGGYQSVGYVGGAWRW